MSAKKEDHTLKILGEYFHNKRVGRGVTLKEASGSWSSATLSRFEHGEVDISVQKAIDLMNRLGIEDTDLLDLYESDWTNFPLAAQIEVQNNDIKTLRKKKKVFLETHKHNEPICKLASILFDAGQYWPDSEYKLSPSDEQILADCFNIPEIHDLLESEFDKAFVGAASHELLDLLWQRAQSLHGEWREVYSGEVMMVWLGALMTRDMALIDDIQVNLEREFSQIRNYSFALQYMSNWNFGRAVATWIRDPSERNEKAVTDIIEDLTAMSDFEDARWFSKMFEHVKTGHMHHNYDLIDHPHKFRVEHSASEVIRFRRERLGVKVTDVDVGISAMTLRRFEAGKTQLAFASLVKLCGELAIMPSQVLAMIDRSSQNVLGKGNLKAAFLKIAIDPAQGVTRPDPHLIIQQLIEQSKDKPSLILASQLFVLNDVANLKQDETLKLAGGTDKILSRLLQMNQWGALEMHIAQALIDWLTPDQIVLLFKKGCRVIDEYPLTVGTNYFYFGIKKQLSSQLINIPQKLQKNFYDILVLWYILAMHYLVDGML
ncbi:transcriptional regulator [Pediococcus siamensis]|uniref:transcriptional regulator n=1 Tax=Pediococcus siamensis TaxID=381829 RepID=UPI0039A24D62